MGRPTKLTAMIDELISLLDPEIDICLIDVLKDKKERAAYKRKQELLEIHGVTDEQLLYAKIALSSAIGKLNLPKPDWYHKVKKILKNNYCSECKFKYRSRESARCRRCKNWTIRLFAIQRNYDENLKYFIQKKILTEQMLKARAMCLKLRKKINDETFTWTR